jgi:cardiolipin synthase (CMP-forming)
VPPELRQLPTQITCARIVLTAILHVVVLIGSRGWFLGLYALAFLSDVLDGYLARRWGLESYFGMRLDSYADYLLIASSVWWAWLYCPEMFLDHARIWGAMGVSLAIPQAIALTRLKRNAGFHLYTTKLTGWIAFALFVHAVAFGYSITLLYALAGAVMIKSAEETAICLLVADPYADLRPSALSYLRKTS